jgi:isocitrate dehydrogenase
LAKEEFWDRAISESELYEKQVKSNPPGELVIKDRMADVMFRQVLRRPEQYDVLVTPNLSGDYMSGALAAEVGGLGMVGGGNIGDGAAVFEAFHGTVSKYANLDVINPGSIILFGKMMFDYLGWSEVWERIKKAMEMTISQKIVTYDLAGQMERAEKVKCSECTSALIENL